MALQVDPQFAPRAQQSQGGGVSLSSMLNLAIGQQEKQRNYSLKKDQYGVSQMVGRLQSFKAEPKRYEAVYNIYTSKPEVQAQFKRAGVDLSVYSPENLTFEDRVSSAKEQGTLEGTQIAARNQVITGIDQGYFKTKQGEYSPVVRHEANKTPERYFYDDAGRKADEKNHTNFNSTYTQFMRLWNRKTNPAAVDIAQVMSAVGIGGMTPDGRIEAIQSMYKGDVRGTEYQALAEQEEDFFQHLIQEKSYIVPPIMGEDGKQQIPAATIAHMKSYDIDLNMNSNTPIEGADLLKLLSRSSAMEGNPSPYYYLTWMEKQKDKKDIPSSWKDIFSRSSGESPAEKASKMGGKRSPGGIM